MYQTNIKPDTEDMTARYETAVELTVMYQVPEALRID